MGKVIDAILQKAILELVNSKAGGQSEVARLCGITQKQISNYVSGKTRAMNDESWRKLYPFLRKFLPAEYINRLESGADPENRGDAVSRKQLIELVIGDAELDDAAKLRVIGIINRV